MSWPAPAEPVPPRSSRCGLPPWAAAAAAAASCVGFVLLVLGPAQTLAAQADLAVVGVDAQDLDLDLVADLDDVLGALDLVVGQLGDVQQPFQARLQLDEDAEVGELGDLALLDLAAACSGRECRLPTDRWSSA